MQNIDELDGIPNHQFFKRPWSFDRFDSWYPIILFYSYTNFSTVEKDIRNDCLQSTEKLGTTTKYNWNISKLKILTELGEKQIS